MYCTKLERHFHQFQLIKTWDNGANFPPTEHVPFHLKGRRACSHCFIPELTVSGVHQKWFGASTIRILSLFTQCFLLNDKIQRNYMHLHPIENYNFTQNGSQDLWMNRQDVSRSFTPLASHRSSMCLFHSKIHSCVATCVCQHLLRTHTAGLLLQLHGFPTTAVNVRLFGTAE